MTDLKTMSIRHRRRLLVVLKLYAFVEEVYPNFYRHENHKGAIYYLIGEMLEEIYK